MNTYQLINSSGSVAKQLALRHKTLRRQCGFSQSDLASRSGVSLGSIKRFETTGLISLESLLKTAQVLDRLFEFDNLLKPIDNIKEIDSLFSNKTKL